jgi:Right handed beta helix region
MTSTTTTTASATAGPATAATAARRRRVLLRGAAAVTAAAAAGALALTLTGAPARAATATNCQATPSACGYPDATNTGVPAGTTLTSVPAQATSGPGWAWDAATQTVNVTTSGTTISGLSITGTLNITASNVTVKNDQITASGLYAVSLRHTASVTVENSDISGQNATTGRVSYAIDDIYADSTNMTFTRNNIADWRVGINTTSGKITSNYIHNPGYLPGDHTDGIYDNEGTTPLAITGNTIENTLGQTCDIILESAPGVPVGNMTVSGNLLAGGGYSIYAGGAQNDSTNIKITGNRFGQAYFAKSGQWGPDADYQPAGTGNTWTGNTWDTTGTTVTP